MKKSAKIGIGVAVGLVVVVGGGYVASYFIAGNQLPAHASVDGVAIGGLSPKQAQEKLEKDLASKAKTSITLVNGSTSVTIKPAAAGLGVSYGDTVKAAGGGFSWNPADIISNFSGGSEVSLVRTVDEAKLTAAVKAAKDKFSADPVDATLTFKSGQVERTDGENGTTLDVDAAVKATAEGWQAGKKSVQAPLKEQEPAVTTAMVDEAVKTFADPLVSGPITLTAGGEQMQISAGALAEAATFTAKDGKLVGSLNDDQLFKDTEDERKALKLTGAKDASFKMSGGKVVVVPAQAGVGVDQQSFNDAVNKAAVATGDGRTAAVTSTTENPKYTTEQAQAVVKDFEVIGEFTTYYPHADYRNTNLGRAASSINGTVLMPNDIFSLNKALGPRTPATGYVDGYVIDGGVLKKESGGGISQSSTTTFNAAFFAGYKDVEHKPHSLYFDRYPAGREATIYYGSFDMRFQNDTQYPSLVQGYINKSTPSHGGSITIKIWSKRTWDKVESTELKKSNFTTGKTITDKSKDCKPQAPIQGFTVNYSRLFYKDGKVVKREPFSWTYSAGNKIVCE